MNSAFVGDYFSHRFGALMSIYSSREMCAWDRLKIKYGVYVQSLNSFWENNDIFLDTY